MMEIDKLSLQDLLFSSSTGLIDFVIIESDIQQIADYGEALIGYSSEKLGRLRLRQRSTTVTRSLIGSTTWPSLLP